MCGNKRRAWMAREHAIALLQKFLLAKGRGAEAPVRMCRQLFKALIPPVNGEEKRVRVGGVEHDRHTQLGRFLEHRREPLVIDPQQGVRRIPPPTRGAAAPSSGASRSSSTRNRLSVESRRLVPRSFQTFRPQAPCSTIF